MILFLGYFFPLTDWAFRRFRGTYMFRTVPLSIIRIFSLYTKAMVIQQAVSKPVWHIPLLCVQWKTPDDGQRNCPQYVEFYSKNKFEKLVHVIGFIIRIYQDARSPERQIRLSFSFVIRSLLYTKLLRCMPYYRNIVRFSINRFKQLSEIYSPFFTKNNFHYYYFLLGT